VGSVADVGDGLFEERSFLGPGAEGAPVGVGDDDDLLLFEFGLGLELGFEGGEDVDEAVVGFAVEGEGFGGVAVDEGVAAGV
jgi:hypothetical protein